MTEDGVLIIDARRYRRQNRNRQDAMARLVELIRKAAKKPKRRRKTTPTLASKERRLDTKHHRGRTKSLRRSVTPSEQ
jgi:ribosome-associated protein